MCDQGCHPVWKQWPKGVFRVQKETAKVLKREGLEGTEHMIPRLNLFKKKKERKAEALRCCLGNWEGFAERVVINLGL